MKKDFWIKFSVMMSIFVSILVLDLVTKYVFDAQLADGSVITVIPYLFNFKLVHNYGAAWGMLAGKQVFLIVLTLIFLGIFIVYYIKEQNKTWLLNITFGFLFAGCFGNLYDRLFFGYVRDFIQFDFWKSFPVFNFADVALTVGVVLFLVYLLIYFLKNRKTEKPKDDTNAK
ncbi:MAG: signal peptidase II [Candidatus Caccovivens sp.]